RSGRRAGNPADALYVIDRREMASTRRRRRWPLGVTSRCGIDGEHPRRSQRLSLGGMRSCGRARDPRALEEDGTAGTPLVCDRLLEARSYRRTISPRGRGLAVMNEAAMRNLDHAGVLGADPADRSPEADQASRRASRYRWRRVAENGADPFDTILPA